MESVSFPFCKYIFPLSHSVTTVDAEIGTGNVTSRIGKEEGDGAHQIFWTAHLTLWDEAGPLLGELWVLVEDLLGTVS